MPVASRFMLPVEMLMGWLMFATGLVGGIGQGTLYHALRERGDNTSWLVLYGAIGLAQTTVALVEWAKLRRAGETTILRVVRQRSFLNAVAALGWMAAFCWLILEGLARTSMMLMMIAPIVCAFNAWAYKENQKVTYALDPAHPTSNLQFLL